MPYSGLSDRYNPGKINLIWTGPTCIAYLLGSADPVDTNTSQSTLQIYWHSMFHTLIYSHWTGTCISNHIHCFMWVVISHPCSKCNEGLATQLLKLRHGWVIVDQRRGCNYSCTNINSSGARDGIFRRWGSGSIYRIKISNKISKSSGIMNRLKRYASKYITHLVQQLNFASYWWFNCSLGV